MTIKEALEVVEVSQTRIATKVLTETKHFEDWK
jgi:hypothetical protein